MEDEGSRVLSSSGAREVLERGARAAPVELERRALELEGEGELGAGSRVQALEEAGALARALLGHRERAEGARRLEALPRSLARHESARLLGLALREEALDEEVPRRLALGARERGEGRGEHPGRLLVQPGERERPRAGEWRLSGAHGLHGRADERLERPRVEDAGEGFERLLEQDAAVEREHARARRQARGEEELARRPGRLVGAAGGRALRERSVSHGPERARPRDRSRMPRLHAKKRRLELALGVPGRELSLRQGVDVRLEVGEGARRGRRLRAPVSHLRDDEARREQEDEGGGEEDAEGPQLEAPVEAPEAHAERHATREDRLSVEVGAEVVRELARRLVAELGVLREGREADLLEVLGRRGAEPARRRGLVVLHALRHVLDRLRPEGLLAREEEVERDSERPHVGARPQGHEVAADRLGRHVERRPYEVARAREASVVLEDPGEAEVGHAREVVVPYEHVRGLQVPVDDALRVRVVHGARHLLEDHEPLVDRDPASLDDGLERRPGDEVHGDEGTVLEDAVLVEADDRRVVELLERARLALEALEVFRVGLAPLEEDLERDLLAAAALVARPVDRAHGPARDLGQDLVGAPGASEHLGSGRARDARRSLREHGHGTSRRGRRDLVAPARAPLRQGNLHLRRAAVVSETERARELRLGGCLLLRVRPAPEVLEAEPVEELRLREDAGEVDLLPGGPPPRDLGECPGDRLAAQGSGAHDDLAQEDVVLRAPSSHGSYITPFATHIKRWKDPARTATLDRASPDAPGCVTAVNSGDS